MVVALYKTARETQLEGFSMQNRLKIYLYFTRFLLFVVSVSAFCTATVIYWLERLVADELIWGTVARPLYITFAIYMLFIAVKAIHEAWKKIFN